MKPWADIRAQRLGGTREEIEELGRDYEYALPPAHQVGPIVLWMMCQLGVRDGVVRVKPS